MSFIKETNLSFNSLSNRSGTGQIVIHHAATNGDVSSATMHGWHQNQGWSGLGYHFIIRGDGTVERGRPEMTVGAHASGFNSNAIGICLAGNFETSQPAPQQIESLSRLLADLCNRYNLTPNAQTIVGHRDLMATACPGRNLYAIMDTLRADVKKAMEGKSTPPSASGKSANEITVDNVFGDGIITDRAYWLGVLSGTITANPEFIKIVLDRYHARLKSS